MADQNPKDWQVLSRFEEIKSPWVTIIGEHLLDDKNQQLEYWRVEKADSLIILAIQNGKFILPSPSYRPGVGHITLDFCGGRLKTNTEHSDQAIAITKREFGLDTDDLFKKLEPINTEGWEVNSSFENQKLYGFIVEFKDDLSIDSQQIGAEYTTTKEGVEQLLKDLSCLQCRALLLEWQRTNIKS